MAEQQESFVSGMTLGVCVGVVGFFLFGTEKGKRLREEVSGVWDGVKHDSTLLPERLKDLHLGGVLEEALHELKGVLELVSEIAHEEEQKSLSRSRRSVKKTTPKKFMGVR